MHRLITPAARQDTFPRSALSLLPPPGVVQLTRNCLSRHLKTPQPDKATARPLPRQALRLSAAVALPCWGIRQSQQHKDGFARFAFFPAAQGSGINALRYRMPLLQVMAT